MKENIVIDYIKSSFAELSKVSWPTKSQAVKLTFIVFIFCMLTAVVIGGLDFGFNKAYTYLLTLTN
ncbi:MAG: preprotein translocase subunit SecE [Candidatus Gracilibacteria bacterium]|jgi:preprotein translocase SecE subunit